MASGEDNMNDRKNSFFNRFKNYMLKAGTSAALFASIAGFMPGCNNNNSTENTPAIQQQPQPQPNQPVGTRLELEETLINHYGTLTKDEEPHLLQDFIMSEPVESGTAAVNCTQSLDFNNLTPKMEKDETGTVDVFLHSPANSEIYTWKADFIDGLTSRINTSNNKLTDLIQQDINIGGKNYRITYAETQWLGGNIDEVSIDMLTAKAAMQLSTNESTVIILDSINYNIDVLSTYTDANGNSSARFSVNGEFTPNLFAGDTFTLASGESFGVYDAGNGWVEFCLGAQSLRIKDGDINDDVFEGTVSGSGTLGSYGNNSQAKARIIGSIDTANNTLTLDSLEITLMADSTQDVFVSKNKSLSDAVEKPGAVLIDVDFNGLADTKQDNGIAVPRNYSILDFNQVTYVDMTIGITGSAQRLSFTNSAGDAYTNIPLVYNNGTEMFLGSKDGNLIATEASGNTEYNVDLEDILVLTKDQDTFVFKYDKFNDDGTDYSIELRDYEDNTCEYTVDSTGMVNINKGGHTFVAYVDTSTGKMAVDLNGDGQINGASVDIVDQYGAKLSLYKQDANTVNAVLTTDQSRLDSGLEETITLAFEKDDKYITITPDSPALYDTVSGDKKGQTRYGVQVIEYANDDARLIYPEIQEEPKVSLRERN